MAVNPSEDKGKTYAFLAASTPPEPAQILFEAPVFDGQCQYVATNPGPDTVYFAYGNTPSETTAKAVVPAPTTPQYVIAVIPGQCVISAPKNAFFTAVKTGAPQLVNIMPAKGN